MSRRLLLVLAAAALSTAAACLPADLHAQSGGDSARPGEVVEAELDSIYQVFTRAYAEADTDLLMDSIYARDGFYLPPNTQILEGQDQFRGQFASFLDPIAASGGPGPVISFDIRDRSISGGLATDIGVYTLKAPGASADDPGSRGKFIVIWKRSAAGEWRIHADGYSAIRN